MGSTLGSLYCRRNLGVRGSEKPGDLLGQRLVGGKTGQLALPQIEIAPSQPVEVGFRGHTVSLIDHHYRDDCSQAQRLPCRTAASALISRG